MIEPVNVNVNLRVIDHMGRPFGVGECTVLVGGVPVDGYAVLAGLDRYITNHAGAVAWLIGHGLPARLANDLVDGREARP